MKLIVTGYGEHGKTEVAQILSERYGLICQGSSEMANRLFIFDTLKPTLGYESAEECYLDRRNRRSLWYRMIKAYNSPDRARLAKRLFESADVYVGIRDAEELAAVRNIGLVDSVVWVDASTRLPTESASSCRVGPQDADFILDNNGSLDALSKNIDSMMDWFLQSMPTSAA